MPNPFFQFKQFTVQQEHCAMKVSTDSCLFGAWVADMISSKKIAAPDTILDIGAGTGLLSLMLAQQTASTIDAIEIDEPAAKQAADNFKDSPWSERITMIHSAVQEYSASLKYDLIICNPPFFSNDLKGPLRQRNVAMHDEALSLQDLLHTVERFMHNDGLFAVLLPYHRSGHFEKLATQSKLHVTHTAYVRQTPDHHFFRTMFILGNVYKPLVHDEINIRSTDGYSAEFRRLLKEYYLQIS